MISAGKSSWPRELIAYALARGFEAVRKPGRTGLIPLVSGSSSASSLPQHDSSVMLKIGARPVSDAREKVPVLSRELDWSMFAPRARSILLFESPVIRSAKRPPHEE